MERYSLENHPQALRGKYARSRAGRAIAFLVGVNGCDIFLVGVNGCDIFAATAAQKGGVVVNFSSVAWRKRGFVMIR